MLEAILAKVHQALNRIGQSSDAASSTGSLHAKVANVQNTVNKIASGVVKSVQRGIVSFPVTTSNSNYYSGTQTVTISAVNTGKAILIADYISNGYATSSDELLGYAVLTNSTTITFYASAPYSTAGRPIMSFSWQVIEYV